MADVDEEEAANSSSAAVVGKTSAYHCTCAGRGLHVATVRALNTFSIQACDAEQQQRTSGGDTFFVSIRGNSKVRARVRDQGDGTYVVEYMPSVSGFYTISISIFGEPLRESPFDLAVINTSPDPVKCECRGDALTTAVARQNHTFEVRYRDALGNVAHAEELDVYVEALPPPDSGDDAAAAAPSFAAPAAVFSGPSPAPAPAAALAKGPAPAPSAPMSNREVVALEDLRCPQRAV